MTGKDMLRITLYLSLIYVVGGIILALVYAHTSPIMFRNAVIAKEAALKELIPEAETIQKLGDWTIHEKHAEYFIAKKGGRIIGYVVQSFGKGYSSYIDTLVAFTPELTVMSINILGHAETPGLGDEIETAPFRDQFEGKDASHLRVVKTGNPEYIQAISGATISSRAVSEDAVKHAMEHLSEVLTKGVYSHGE